MVFKSLWSFFVKSFILSFAIHTAKAHAETLLFYENYWPFSYVENGQTKGLYYDLATSIFDSMEKEYSVEVYPFKRSLMLSVVGEGLVVGIFKTDERSIELEFSEPFYHEESVLFPRMVNSYRSRPRPPQSSLSYLGVLGFYPRIANKETCTR